jgi:hypothetical protein
MKKFFTAISLASVCLLSHSQSLTPLSVWMKQRPNWQDDKTEIAYFALRCNIFLKFVGVYFITRSDEQAGIDRGKNIDLESEVFTLPALHYGGISGYTTADILKRADKIQNEYVIQIAKNKDLTNSIFDGYVGDDFRICKNAVPNFKLLSEMLVKQSSEAK